MAKPEAKESSYKWQHSPSTDSSSDDNDDEDSSVFSHEYRYPQDTLEGNHSTIKHLHQINHGSTLSSSTSSFVTITTGGNDPSINTVWKAAGKAIHIPGDDSLCDGVLIREGGHFSKRQRKEFIVLTQTKLLRFKSFQRACEHFTSLFHDSKIAVGITSSTKFLILELEDVLAVHELPNNRSGKIQIDYEHQNVIYHVTFTAKNVDQHRRWLGKFCETIRKRIPRAITLSSRHRELVTEKLKSLDDLPERSEHLVALRVLQLDRSKHNLIAANKIQEESQVVIFALGKNNLFIFTSMESFSPENDGRQTHQTQRFSLLAITHIIFKGQDDTLELIVRRPYEKPQSIFISSSACDLILQELQTAMQSLTPWYKKLLCHIEAPSSGRASSISSTTLSTPGIQPDGDFSNCLEAYCQAYHVDRERICVKVARLYNQNTSSSQIFDEDTKSNTDRQNSGQPNEEASLLQKKILTSSMESISRHSLDSSFLGVQVIILPPIVRKNTTDTSEYSASEILVLLRSMRHNESIREIIFRCGSLAALEVIDPYMGKVIDEELEQYLNQGQSANEIAAKLFLKNTSHAKKHQQPNHNPLVFELYRLLTGNSKLSKIDFSHCELKENYTSSGTMSVFGAVLKSQMAGLDSLHFGGNKMSYRDISSLVQGIQAHKKPIKVLDISCTGLQEDSVNLVIENLLSRFPKSLEMLDISQNSFNMSRSILTLLFSSFLSLSTLRLGDSLHPDYVLNLPCLTLPMLANLVLSGTSVSSNSAHVISQYIRSDKSAALKTLAIENCNLNGEDISIIFQAISENRPNVRLLAGSNPIAKTTHDFKKICNCIALNQTPCWLGLSRIEWVESQLRTFLRSLCLNNTIEVLDLSFPILTRDIDDTTTLLIRQLFAQNSTLREINLAGEDISPIIEDSIKSSKGKSTDSFLLSYNTRYGPKLGKALDGLKKNTALVKLDLTGNDFGDEGAEKLSESLQVNTTLRELGIDNNKIEDIGFVKLFVAISANKTLIRMPQPKKDLNAFFATRTVELQQLARGEVAAEYARQAAGPWDRKKLQEQLEMQKEGRRATEQMVAKIGRITRDIRLKLDANRKEIKKLTPQLVNHTVLSTDTTVVGKSWGYYGTSSKTSDFRNGVHFVVSRSPTRASTKDVSRITSVYADWTEDKQKSLVDSEINAGRKVKKEISIRSLRQATI
ncbi:hypothetical protein G9A89_002292 [Geosiphon pyriformis]|nr:hypothetical protein G9A89_002292 [Geosiphon pyriformis]